ncbi:MAG TPA: hypothetical protein VFG99_03395, partial [Chloroflexia bacterium]|nr:hypothetical protein [Chloroflexia bacterium]
PILAALASDLGIPLAATNDVLYIEPGDATVAAALASARPGGRSRASDSGRLIEDEGIHHDPHAQRLTAPPTGRHLASTEEMAALFEEYPQALANARFIADQCDVELPLHKPLFPAVDLGRRGNETPFSRLWKLCFAGATRLYKPLDAGVISRLKHELEVIEKLGFSPYFLVVYDIALFARRKGIPTMARGSAANSLVAYVLGITQVDPLAHDLLFERFLNPSRAEFELPDIDIDLCWRRRDEVLHYVYERYGRDHVAIVGTHITFRLRSAWREMAKALGIHPDRINRVASRLPHLFTAEEILEESAPELEALSEDQTVRVYGVEETLLPNLVTEDQKFRDALERQAFELCKAIEGLPRHAGMHCAGVVITPGPITDLVPLQRAARDVHDSLAAIPFDDAATYRMLAQGDTLGCFQLESPGMRGLLKWLRPRGMNDMAAAISLFRPGPMEGGFLEIFMRRHLGQEPVSYPHPSMEPILKGTYGIILYQEQFLRLGHILGGLSLGDAEKLRKEIGKSRSAEERARLGASFVAGCIERGIDQMQAERVWEIISGYTGFGFCQAHAYSYALTAYRSAYMKAHHPAQYMAAQINNLGGYYGTGVYVEDARRLGLELLPPHANLSGAFCEAGQPPDTRRIRFGLQFVKGLSEKTIALIQSERRARGPFRHLLDLLSRVEMSPSEAASLVKVGACDDLGTGGEGPGTAESDTGELAPLSEMPPLNRRQMLWLLPTIISHNRPKRASTQQSTLITQNSPRSLAPIQLALGDLMHDVGAPRILGGTTLRIDVPDMPDFSLAEKLRLEREVLGFTLTRNEMELYGDMVAARGIVPSHALGEYAGHKVTVAGVIAAGRRHLAKGGEWMLFASLQDSGGLMEVVLFPEVYKEHATLIANNGCGPYLVTGTVQVAGKGRGVGVQLPVGVRPSDATVLKTHPVVIVEGVAILT